MVKIIGSQIRNVTAEKKEIKEELKDFGYKYTAKLENIEEARKMEKGSVLIAKYLFGIDYTSNEKVIATIKIHGDIAFAYPTKTAGEIMTEWKKSKKVSKAMYSAVEKVGYENAIVESVAIAKMLKLPIPIPMKNLFKKQ